MHKPPGESWNSWQSTGAAKAMVVCWDWPSMFAVTTAFWLLLTFPEIASNVAPLWPAGTVTLGGTESNVLLLAIDTTESVAAAAFNVTEHLPTLLLTIAEGEHDIDFGPFF
jgi:hypothetical protein